jgi:hypothetical protein
MSELSDLGKSGLDKIVINSLNLSSDLLNDVVVPRIIICCAANRKTNQKQNNANLRLFLSRIKPVQEESIRLEGR